ncbi:MAG: FAD-dependent oxidoreductase [Deltaproteobacteria bacterium]|nr:MAG: FAD-dependent oxidoreductase [Deltaproteobacteria bacterium]
MKHNYDVIIIGAGPAGIFTSMTLAKMGIGRVLLIEQGKDIDKRDRRSGRDMLCGWGGAGAYSDGKLNLSTEVGGFLSEFMSSKKLEILLREADKIYLRYGAPEKIFGANLPEIEILSANARKVGLTFVPTMIRHMGTENCISVLERMRQDLTDETSIKTECRVEEILTHKNKATGVRLADGQVINGHFVVAAPGRIGAGWMKSQADLLNLSSVPSPVDIGLRIEAPAPIMEPLTKEAYEAKLIYYSKTFDDKVRTFCMNPYGEVVLEQSDDIITVNGHSYAQKKSDNTNFALLVSSTFTDPFHDPIKYGKYIASLANMLGKGPIIQRLGDLLAGRRSTEKRIGKCITKPTLHNATPGDLSFVLPYRYLKDIIEMLEILDNLAPGIFSRHTLLYGVEVKFYSHRIKLTNHLESDVRNLFIIGDGAGITRGLIQASISGIVAGEEIASRLKG